MGRRDELFPVQTLAGLVREAYGNSGREAEEDAAADVKAASTIVAKWPSGSRRARRLVRRAGRLPGPGRFALLYFSQARDVRRLRDWAGRARARAGAAWGGRATEVARRRLRPHSRHPRAEPRSENRCARRIRNVHIPSARYIAMGAAALLVAGWRGLRRGSADRRRSGTTTEKSANRDTHADSRQERRDKPTPGGQHRSVPGDVAGPERGHGAGSRRAGADEASAGGFTPGTTGNAARDRPVGVRSALPPGPGRRGRPGPSPTGSASSKTGRSTRSTRRSPARSTSWSWSAPIDDQFARLRRPATVPVLVFAGLLVATSAAFFVTTQAEARPRRWSSRSRFAAASRQTGTGASTSRCSRFDCAAPTTCTVSIVDARRGRGTDTRRGRPRSPGGGVTAFAGTGTTPAAGSRPTASTSLTRGLRHQGRTVTSSRKLFLDTVPPQPVVSSFRRTRSRRTARAPPTARRCGSSARRAGRGSRLSDRPPAAPHRGAPARHPARRVDPLS